MVAVEDVEDADAAVAVVMDHPVTVTGPARTVETLRLAVAVERDLEVAAVEAPEEVEAVEARKSSAWTRKPSPPWARLSQGQSLDDPSCGTFH